MKSACFSSEFDLLGSEIFLGRNPNEAKFLRHTVNIDIKCLSEEKVAFYCRPRRPSLGRKMEKYAVRLVSVFLLSHLGVLRT